MAELGKVILTAVSLGYENKEMISFPEVWLTEIFSGGEIRRMNIPWNSEDREQKHA